MDPNACLGKILAVARGLVELNPEEMDLEDLESNLTDAVEMSQMIMDLDEWIKKGGFLPADWRVYPKE